MPSIELRVTRAGKTIFRVKVRLRGHPDQSASFERLTEARRWAQQTEAAIREAWDRFMHHIQRDTPPALSDRDELLRDDAERQQRAATYVAAKRLAADATESLDVAKEALVALTSHSTASGAGVTVTRYWMAGNVDYKKVPELRGIDLDRYRGPPRLETRVSVSE